LHINFRKTRLIPIFAVSVTLFAILFGRLFYIQVIKRGFYRDLASGQHELFVKLAPRRGGIYDRRRSILAAYLDVPSIYSVPREIKEKENTSRILASEFGLDEEELLKRLGRDNYFAWVKRKITADEEERLKNLNLKGVYLIKEKKRFYPAGALACHVLGLVDIDNRGLEGAELAYDRILKGEPGWRRSFRDARQREIYYGQADVLPARDGFSIVLTIDEVIQHILEKEAGFLVKKYRPEAVSMIAIEPSSGEILGMVNYPAFNPNRPDTVETDSLRNRAITDAFEPGSVFKVVTASSIIEEGAAGMEDEFFCENGAYRVAGRVLHDYRAYGTLTFREVIEKSSNIGTVKAASRLGKEKLCGYIRKFGFGEKTGIDLPGEATGIVRDPSGWSASDMTTVPMGQGIAVTPIQLAACVGAVANDGVLMKPRVLKEIMTSEGITVRKEKPETVRRVISKKKAQKVKELLAGVVARGSGRRAKLDNFTACGKTGTAQKVNPEGGYYKNKYIASFVGFAPSANPRVALVVSVDNPRGGHLGGRVAAPAFKRTMENILSYLERGSENEGDETKISS